MAIIAHYRESSITNSARRFRKGGVELADIIVFFVKWVKNILQVRCVKIKNQFVAKLLNILYVVC